MEKKSDLMEGGEKEAGGVRGSMSPLGPDRTPLGVTDALRRLLVTLGPVLAVALVAVAFVGTTVASWLGSVAILEASGIRSAYALHALSANFTIVGLAAEILKVALAPQLDKGRLHRQTVVLVAWVLCVMYGWLMPVLLLMHMPIWPAAGGAVFLCAVKWAFVQVMSGLVLSVRWSTSGELGIVDHLSASAEKPMPNPPADRATSAAGKQPARLDDDACFALLREVASQPGAALGSSIRIAQNGEMTASQRDLAILLGVSKPTVNRLLHRLAKQGRLSLETNDGITRIRLP
jgi:Crp-like helix-turn-helix domain